MGKTHSTYEKDNAQKVLPDTTEIYERILHKDNIKRNLTKQGSKMATEFK